MIKFNKIDKTQYQNLKSDFKNLYLETFTKGLSAQHIEEADAVTYLNEIFTNGYSISGFDGQKLISALMVVPVNFDDELPEDLRKSLTNKQVLYIAEVLVAENYRGLGISKRLFEKFESDLSKSVDSVLLRVWDKNPIAVQLYKKQGFEPCGEIIQQKLKPISRERFEMKKIYMLKSYHKISS